MRTIVLTFLLIIASPVLYAAELGEAYVKLFRVQLQLANTGSPGAQYSLGEMYEQGLGTQTDMNKAYEWYEKAAKQGDIRAKHKLATRASEQEAAQQTTATQTPPAPAATPKPKPKPAVAATPKPARKPTVEEVEKMRAEAEALLEKQRKRGEQGDIGW